MMLADRAKGSDPLTDTEYSQSQKDLTPRQIRGSIQVYRMLVYAQPRPYRRIYSAVGPINRSDSSAANNFR